MPIANYIKGIEDYISEAGNKPPGSNNQSAWQQAMNHASTRQAALAKGLDWQTLLGMLAGRGLMQLFNSWKDRYDARGDLNSMIETKGADGAQDWINSIAKKNPKQGAYLQGIYNKKFPQANAGAGQAAPDTNSSAMQAALRAIDNQNPADWLGQNPTSQAPYFGNQEQAVENVTKNLLGGNNPLTQSAPQDFSEMRQGIYSDEMRKLASVLGFGR